MRLYELILINEQVLSMITDKVEEFEIEKVLSKHSRPLHESGYAAVLDGRTSLQEVLRVTQV